MYLRYTQIDFGQYKYFLNQNLTGYLKFIVYP